MIRLRWVIAIPIILIGAFLFSLTIDDMGDISHLIMRIIRLEFFYL